MSRHVHPAISYTTIIIGAVFVASAIFVITKVGTPDIVWAPSPHREAVRKAPVTEKMPTIKDEIAAKTALFSDGKLASAISVSPGHFTFNEILSNSENKIVYAELSECSSEKSYSDCEWDYSIKIFDASTGKTSTLHVQNGDKTRPRLNGIIYYPIAWTKNDKKIILSWHNLLIYGQGFAPPSYTVMDASTGQMENPGAFTDCNATIFDSDTQAITATNRNGYVLCAEGDEVVAEQIIVTNAETGKTTVIVGKEKGFGHAIKSFNPLTRMLTYTIFPCEETGQACEAIPVEKASTKTIEVNTK